MALQRPPQHRVDAEPVYIDVTDDAWDATRIEAELAEAKAENKRREEKADGGDFETIDTGDHPVVRYRAGLTRYDLDATCFWRGKQVSASEYLTGEATRFVLKRLSWDEYYRVRSAAMRDIIDAYVLACRIGLKAIEGDTKVRLNPDLRERSSEEMQRLFDLNPEIPIVVGKAVWEASQPLTEAEKKASAS